MNGDKERAEIQAWFDALREGMAAGPGFADTWEAARSRQTRQTSGHLRSWHAVVTVSFLLVLVVPALLFRDSPAPVRTISQWESPTAFLIDTPGRKTLSTVPRVGIDLFPSGGGLAK